MILYLNKVKKKYYWLACCAVLPFFVYVAQVSGFLRAPLQRFDNTEDAFVDNVLLDLGKLSDERVTPKVFFLDVPILTYHQVRPMTESDDERYRRFITTPEEFERQMQFIKDQGYNVISLSDAVVHLANNKPLHGKNIAITFDDGYRSQYTFAFPILQKFGYTGTFFIYTNAIDNLNASMTWEEISDLDGHGMTIGAHTRSHAMLTNIGDKKILRDEIEGSKEDIQAHLQKNIDLFAYPFGAYDESIKTEVESAGFRGAVSVNMGHLQTKDIRYALKRYNVNDNDIEFRALLQANKK